MASNVDPEIAGIPSGTRGGLDRARNAGSHAREHGLSSLSTDDLRRFPLLYRAALSSLSVARAIALDRALLTYLEDLSLRAFLAIYARPLSVREPIERFLLRSLPRAVRSIGLHVFIALGALLLGVLSGFLLVYADEGWYPVIIPAGLARRARARQHARRAAQGALHARPLRQYAGGLRQHPVLE